MFVYLGYLEFCKLPPNFNAISYALKIYQKCKSNDILKLKLLDLCKSLSKNLDLSQRKQHIEEHLKIIGLEDMVEKSIIISYFLKDFEVSLVKTTGINSAWSMSVYCPCIAMVYPANIVNY